MAAAIGGGGLIRPMSPWNNMPTIISAPVIVTTAAKAVPMPR